MLRVTRRLFETENTLTPRALMKFKDIVRA